MATSSISQALGILPGSAADQLSTSVDDETEEEKKKRLAAMQKQAMQGNAMGQSAAVNSLFGGEAAYGQ